MRNDITQSDCFENEKYLITGAGGFLGKHVLRALADKGVPRENVALISSKETDGYKTYIYTQSNPLSVDLMGYSPDCVIHLGAVAPKTSREIKDNHYAQNVVSTWNLLRSLDCASPSKFVFASSVSVYGDGAECNPKSAPNLTILIDESTPVQPTDAYGMSKYLCEGMLQDWSIGSCVDLQVLRLGPIYGPGEEAYNKITGAFVRKALDGDPLCILSDGHEKRNLLYVGDAAEYIAQAAVSHIPHKCVNLIAEQDITVLELAKTIVRSTCSDSDIIVENGPSGRNESYSPALMMRAFPMVESQTTYSDGIRHLADHFRSLL